MKIVAIGGGTGLSTLLGGLRQFVAKGDNTQSSPGDCPRISRLTAVVAVSDDGGSSGALRREFKVLPPGDIRNCLVAMSQADPLLAALFQYRFHNGDGFKGHSFGNVFVTALASLTGDFALAVKMSSSLLNACGAIYPATVADVDLVAKMDDGSFVSGETNITNSKRRIVELSTAPANPDPIPETLNEINEADMITIGPGSLYTSLIANLLVRGIPEAIARSKARKILICNLMTQPNESLEMTAADHIRAIYEHCGISIFDSVLVNIGPISSPVRSRYKQQGGGEQVAVDIEAIQALGVRPILGEFQEENAGKVRHCALIVAKKLLEDAINPKPAPASTGPSPHPLPMPTPSI